MRIDLSRFRNKSKCQKGNRRVLKMLEVKDPAIKLFGKTIPLPDNQIPVLPEEKSDPEYQVPVEPEEKDACRETKETEEEEGAPTEECRNQEKPSSNDGKEGKHQAPTDEEEKATMDSDHEEDQADTDVATQEKILKKPDKLLPCPRCNSLDTKFCYFNNYNVNQPRHFCKNCQRYWTAGGTMRNVPVGAGRRKNKNSVLHHRHLMMSSDAMLSTRTNHSDSANHQISTGGELPSLSKPLKESGKVLKFGPDAPLCDSMASVLSLGEQKRNVEAEKVAGAENGEEPSRNSSMTVSTSQENVAHIIQNRTPECCDGPTPMHPLQCYPGPPWAFQWNHGWNNVAPMAAGRCSSDLVYRQDGSNPSLVQWAASPMVAAPSFCLPNIPFPYMAAPYWGCMPNWPASAWNNTPWLGSNGSLSSSSSTSNSGCSGNGSPTLGKHSRDASVLGEEKLEKSLWVPKTLRIDDPDEAAKSSIWATLGIKQDENGPRTKGGIFKAFQPKMEKQVASDATNVLQANPAALSRSQTFQEST